MDHSIFSRVLIFSFFLSLGLAGCNLPGSAPIATTSINVTQAYGTVQARLTQAATQAPAVTPSPLPTATEAPPTATGTAVTEAPTVTSQPDPASPTATCDRAAAGNPIDVTIPDDTELRPGQAFTKTWRLENVGSCTWTNDYTVELFSGDAMSAPASVPLPREVAPGQSVDISVDMIAPQAGGTYQGNWKLRNNSDTWFGIGPNGSAPFWVRVEVTGLPTVSPTLTTTTTPGVTATPVVAVACAVTLLENDKLDLDSNGVNTGSGEDLSFEVNAEGKHLLIPQGIVILGTFGPNQPAFNDCRSAALSAAPLILEDIPSGTYVCYRTNGGLPGRAQISGVSPVDFTLTLDVLTWSLP